MTADGASGPTVAAIEQLRARVVAASDDLAALGALFDELVAEHGRDEASALWWAVFGAGDASET